MRKLFAIYLLLPLLILVKVGAQDDTCADLLPPRLTAGDTGRVVPNEGANNMRNAPSTNAAVIVAIAAGDSFDVLSDPTCADGYYWYEVEYNGQTGFTAESGGGSYWIEPIIVFTQPERRGPNEINLVPEIGGQVRVITESTLSLRTEPSVNAPIQLPLADRAVLDVLDGPVNADNFRWWQVRTEGNTVGWAVDGVYSEEGALLQTLLPPCPYTENRIAFTGSIYPGGTRDYYAIFTTDPDGSNVCLLHVSPIFDTTFRDLHWMPDGETLIFTEVQDSFRIGGAVTAMNPTPISADGLRLEEPYYVAQYTGSVAVSPDGERLAMVTNLGGTSGGVQVWVINTDRTGLASLTDTDLNKGEVMWSPDGETLYYRQETGPGSQSYEVMMLPLATGIPQSLGVLDSGSNHGFGVLLNGDILYGTDADVSNGRLDALYRVIPSTGELAELDLQLPESSFLATFEVAGDDLILVEGDTEIKDDGILIPSLSRYGLNTGQRNEIVESISDGGTGMGNGTPFSPVIAISPDESTAMLRLRGPGTTGSLIRVDLTTGDANLVIEGSSMVGSRDVVWQP